MQTQIDDYIRTIVLQHTPVISYNVQSRLDALDPHILAWANGHKYKLKLTGSVAKGTAITGTSDIDIFISLNPSVGIYNTLDQVYMTLRNRLNEAGYIAREQNVSLGINHAGLKIDIVPGVQHHLLGSDHSIWKRKAKTWTKTNVDAHIKYVSESGRTFDIKSVKIWRKLRELDFPSFYLELSVIESLKGQSILGNSPSQNFMTIMQYLATDFLSKAVKDPANQANEISDELTIEEKEKIRDAAKATMQGQWNQALW